MLNIYKLRVNLVISRWASSLFCSILVSLGNLTAQQRPNILFLIADDWSYPHAGVYGDPVVRTPTFDRLAREGALFHQAFVTSPSCSPSRASILTGLYPHQLESGGNLWSVLPRKFSNWVEILQDNGYFTGKSRKGWGPGDFEAGGYETNPAGRNFQSFSEFYAQKPGEAPFCFWFGSNDPHREYTVNTGIQAGMDPEQVKIPPFLPQNICVANDLLDYYFEVERFDRECGQILDYLAEAGELDNTLIIMTSDNGMPFPRSKANLYDFGTRMPLVLRWPSRINANTQIYEFMSFADFAPTILEAAGLQVPAVYSGYSLWPLLNQEDEPWVRKEIYLERERHANVRKGDLSYPMRAVRDGELLYIRNIIPERWPAGDPSVHRSVGQFGDVDNSITKYLIMQMAGPVDSLPDYFALSFAKRPPEELYDLTRDPYQMNNLWEDPAYTETLASMRSKLDDWMEHTHDPRFENPESIYWDTVRYVPQYQFQNFDLESVINNYRVVPPLGPDRESGIPCLK